MSNIILSLFEEHPCLKKLSSKLKCELGHIIFRNFPDGESYLKFDNDLKDKNLIILDSLDYPNNKILPLVFTANLAKELGSRSIGLCTPYLSYMRQDKRFKPGEAVTSKYFANIISESFDWLVTVDPHLHRYNNLNEIYSIPAKTLHASANIAQYITNNIDKPILIGPDSESGQWVSEIASYYNIPFVILDKTRFSDYDVKISKPQIDKYINHNPVLIDDIISTGRTMIETIKHLINIGMQAPICIAVHAIFANNSYELLKQAGAAKIISCNSVNHHSNQIDISDILVTQLDLILNN